MPRGGDDLHAEQLTSYCCIMLGFGQSLLAKCLRPRAMYQLPLSKALRTSHDLSHTALASIAHSLFVVISSPGPFGFLGALRTVYSTAPGDREGGPWTPFLTASLRALG